MCGIVGFFAADGGADATASLLVAMRDTMRSRGPDDAGVAVCANGLVHLGHRRLSIIELSQLGHQPMMSDDRRLTIVYNGEIYNHLELRPDLEAKGWNFRSGSDTETILAAYRIYGLAAFARLRGMFALAIWDEAAGELVLARDPHGIKPLYYRHSPTFAFASQVTALLADPTTARRVDPAAVAAFSIWGSVPEPNTIVEGIKALPAGHMARIRRDGRSIEIESFLTLEQTLRDSLVEPETDPCSAVRASVRHHMLADTEVGCFLSAGVDSGAILGMMRDHTDERILALTLRFAEFSGTEKDESVLAAEVARYYGADHRVETIDARDFADSMPRILDSMDQPSIDGVNTWLVSRAAAKAGLRVALSGLGGDELIGGYSTFRTIPATWRLARAARWTGPIGAAARAMLRHFGRGKARVALDWGDTLPGAYLLRRAMVVPDTRSNSSHSHDNVLANVRRYAGKDGDPLLWRISLLESSIYMRNQLLRDSDWAGMAHSLEIRLPLVDITLSRQLAGLLPQFAGGKGKAMLANAPRRPLPEAVVNRRKTGFGVPVLDWLDHRHDRPQMTDWAGRVLDTYVERHRLSF